MTDLTDAEWALLAPFIPPAELGGRPRSTDMREALNALFYLPRGGCARRLLPHEFPKWKTIFGGELNQVWTNLIDNAVDAMGEGGRLRLTTRREPTHAMVEVRDNGPGIPEEVRPHLFEPFFTTKPVGEGTGLGLDTALRIVRKHRGDIRFETKPGDTCFQVRLPLVRGGVSR